MIAAAKLLSRASSHHVLLYDALPCIDEPVAHLLHGDACRAGHLLLLCVAGVWLLKVFKKPALHDGCSLYWKFAVFATTTEVASTGSLHLLLWCIISIRTNDGRIILPDQLSVK